MPMHEQIRHRLEKAVSDRVFPGAVVGIVKADGSRLIVPVGRFTYEPESPAVQDDTIYDLASVTKSIPGSSSLLKLIDEGRVGLDDRLVDYVPEFGTDDQKREVRIRHVLTYTLDLEISSMSALKDKTAEELMDLVVKAKLKSPPGSRYVYTNSTATFIGLIVEKVTGKPIDAYADEIFFTPLNMSRTTFYPERFPKEEIAPTEIDSWRGRTIQGEVHDESTFILRQRYMTTAAGLFSTVPDLLSFLEMLLNKGERDGNRYFSEDMVTAMHTDYIQNGKDKAGLGWVIEWPEALGASCSSQTFCKSGFTGTLVAVDPVKEIAYAFLSNRTYPHRAPDTKAITSVRKDISDIVFSA